MSVSRACLAFVVLATAAAVTPAVAADAVFSGGDAAFLDWGVKNCGLRSSPAAHALVETARGKSQDTFNRQYMQQFQSAAFAAAATDKARRDRVCRDVIEAYGKSGTRFPRLLAAEGEALQQPEAAPSRPAKAEAAGGKGGGPGRRHGGS